MPEGMRYPDGGGLTAAARARRQVVRLQAAELFEQGWSGPRVAGELRVSRMSAWRWELAWREGGVEALWSKRPASECLLDQAQCTRLLQIIEAGPAAFGWERDQRWTLARICAVAADEFGVCYTLSGMWRLLDRIGASWQVPAVRAAERDEAAVAAWREETWPEIKRQRASSGPRSASRTRQGTRSGRPKPGPGGGAGAPRW
jgi:transposase